MAENYEPLAPAGGANLPPPPASPAAEPAPAQENRSQYLLKQKAPVQSTEAPGTGGKRGGPPYPPLLPPKKKSPGANKLPLARKNKKPKSPNLKSSSVTFGPATIIGGDDKVSENASSIINENGNTVGEGTVQKDLVSGAGNYTAIDTVTTGKTRRNNIRFYCMITSGIMGGIFAVASIIIGIFTFVRE